MKTSHSSFTKVKISLICLSFFSAIITYSQEKNDDELFNSYQSYIQLPRETCYAHLNKSTLVSGESLGFTVYLFDKYTKRSSVVTRNVYCTLETRSGKVLKKQMILANDGVASGLGGRKRTTSIRRASKLAVAAAHSSFVMRSPSRSCARDRGFRRGRVSNPNKAKAGLQRSS